MADNVPTIVAGTTIARDGYGVLLRGASGRGKSDLALRALSAPLLLPGEQSAQTFELVSDDQTVLTLVNGTLLASAPAALRGKLEVTAKWPMGVEVFDAVSGTRLETVELAGGEFHTFFQQGSSRDYVHRITRR